MDTDSLVALRSNNAAILYSGFLENFGYDPTNIAYTGEFDKGSFYKALENEDIEVVLMSADFCGRSGDLEPLKTSRDILAERIESGACKLVGLSENQDVVQRGVDEGLPIIISNLQTFDALTSLLPRKENTVRDNELNYRAPF
jgi:hypothetical protein